MIGLPQLKARVERIGELEQGLARELARWQGQDGPLLPAERRQYLGALTNALAALDDARAAMTAVVRRLDGPQAARRAMTGRPP